MRLLALPLMACLLPGLAHAQETASLNVSTRLLDSSGAPVDQLAPVQIRLWSAETGGTLLHLEDLGTVQLEQGYLQAQIHPSADDLMDGSVFVEWMVDGATLPRSAVGEVPSAVVARGLRSSLYSSASEALADGLITYYGFEANTPLAAQNCEGASIAPTVGSGSGVCYGSTDPAPGIAGLGMYRGNGTNHGLRVDIGADYTVFTMSLWFFHSDMTYHSTNDGAGIVWLNGDDVSGNQLIGINGNPAFAALKWGYWPRFSGTGGASDEGRYTGVSITQGQWIHYALTQDASGTSRLYLNGQEIDTRTDFPWNLGQTLYVANYFQPTGGNPNNHYARGTADELALWSRDLSDVEIGRLYRAQRAGQHLVP